MTRYIKSFVAVLVAGLTVLASAITDDKVTNAEWVNIALAVVGALGVYALPNRPPAGEPSDPTVSEQDPQRGAVDVVTVLVIVLLVVVILAVAGVL